MRINIEQKGELTLPDELLQNLRTVHGASVDSWLSGLGSLLKDVLDSRDAHLAPGDPPLSYHLVFFAEQASGAEITVKCTVPSWEQRPEVAGVVALSDAGIGPELCWSDLDRGILIMKRVRPGATMPTALPSLVDDARITRGVATLAAGMARDVIVGDRQDDLVPVRYYTRALEDVNRSSSLWSEHRDDVQRALELRNALLAAADHRDVFLHGDLHHYNILQNNDQRWSVIDPKGLFGPSGYEFGAFTYNPVGIQYHPELATLTRQRVDIWSEVTGIPWETVRSWGYVAAMLSACWSAEDSGKGWLGAMTIAGTLRDIEPVR